MGNHVYKYTRLSFKKNPLVRARSNQRDDRQQPTESDSVILAAGFHMPPTLRYLHKLHGLHQ